MLESLQKTIEEKIKYHQEKYYNEDPEISDDEFDALWDQLKKEDPKNKLLKDIGDTTWEGFQKMKHIMVMGSQDKFNNVEDFRNWLRIKRISFPIVVEYKLDGLSIELQYENGKLIRAITRGDGYIGDDVTLNVIKMSGVPKEIDKDFTGAIRGEIELKNTVFNKFFKDAKNPRNMASGITKRKNGTDSEHLSVIVYDVYIEDKNVFSTELEKISFLEKNKFEVVEYKFCNNEKEILDLRNKIVEIRNNLDVAIDGIVLKQNIIIKSDLERKRPEYQRAFKFETEQVVTKLIDIEWSRSGHNYTPVAILEPINLMGSTIKRASLANIDNIEKLNIRVNDDVLIHKAGEIIPQILKVVNEGQLRHLVPAPVNCEVCNTKLELTGPRVYCPNLDCDGRKFHRLEKWIAKTGVKGFGSALLNHLFDNNFVKDIIDLYTLNLELVLSSTNLKKATAKAFANLYKIKEMKLETFVSGFDIEGIGEGVVKFAVDAKIDTLKDLHNASISNFEMVDGFSEGRATLLYEAMQSLYEEMIELTKYIKIKEVTIKESNLNSMSFCFTGKLENITRTKAQNLVVENGHIMKGGVSKDLDFLVTNTPESGSSKNKKALAFGTELITEEHFMRKMKD